MPDCEMCWSEKAVANSGTVPICAACIRAHDVGHMLVYLDPTLYETPEGIRFADDRAATGEFVRFNPRNSEQLYFARARAA